jgi:hypothetical protein
LSERHKLIRQFLFELELCNLPQVRAEYEFHPTRKWRFDYAWIKDKIALEIDGGVRGLSGHFSRLGFQSDQVKCLEADILGWRVIHANYGMIINGVAIQLIQGAFRSRESEAEGKRVPQVFEVGRLEEQSARRAKKGQLFMPAVRRKRAPRKRT